MTGIEKRLSALEQAGRRQLGYRVFVESHQGPGLFVEGCRGRGEPEPGQCTYTSADLSELAGQGWQVIRVVYENQESAG